MKYQAAVIQMKIQPEDKRENFQRAVGLVEEAAAAGARLICLPDYFLTTPPSEDNTVDEIRSWGESIPGPTTDKLSAITRRLNLYLVAGSMVELGDDGKCYSTSPLIGPDGVIGKVRKAHPENAPAKREISRGITPADGEYPVFDTPLGKLGIMIDMDGTACEVPRILGLKGADIICWPTNFSARFTAGIHLMTCYNTIAACYAYVATASGIGWRKNVPVHDWAFMGETRVDLMYGGGSGIAFGGGYLAIVPDFSEGIAVTLVDSERPRQVRALREDVMPLQRRPETYRYLVEH